MTARIFGSAGVVLGVISLIAVVWIKLVMRKPLFVPEPLLPGEPTLATQPSLEPAYRAGE